MAQAQPLTDFFNQCEYLAALWRFDRIATTAEEVIFERADEDNFVKSFLRFRTAEPLAHLSTEQGSELTGAMDRVTDTMIEALRVPKLGTRRRMIRLLGRLGIWKAYEPLMLILEKAESSKERETAAEALGRLGIPEATHALLEVIRDKSLPDSLRGAAIEAVGCCSPGENVDALVDLFEENERHLCSRVAQSLRQVDADRVIANVERKWTAHKLSNFGRLRAAELVVRLSDAARPACNTLEYEELITNAINSEDADLAQDAISFAVDLGLLCEAELGRAARSGADRVREFALESLGRCGARVQVLECLPMIFDERIQESIRRATAKAALAVGLEKELTEMEVKETASKLLSTQSQVTFRVDGEDVERREQAEDNVEDNEVLRSLKGASVVETEYRGDWLVKFGLVEMAEWPLPLEQYISNYPADTSRLAPNDLAVRDILKLAKLVDEDRVLTIGDAKARISDIKPTKEVIFELLKISEDVFSDSYSGALTASELALHATKEFSAVGARMFVSLQTGRICVKMLMRRDPNDERPEPHIKKLIQPFPSLLDRSLDAYQDAAESHHILRTYFTARESLDEELEREVQAGVSFIGKHAKSAARFLKVEPVHIYRTLIERVEANAPENAPDASRHGSILQLSDAVCRIALWAEHNAEGIANGDIVEVQHYLVQGADNDKYRRAINVAALGAGLYDGQQLRAATDVLKEAERALSAIHQEHHEWHVQVLCAHACLDQGKVDAAQDCLRRIDEQKLQALGELVLTVQADLGYFLLAKARLKAEREASIHLAREARPCFRLPWSESSDRRSYLQNLHFSMMMRRANRVAQSMGITPEG
jgi:hypothetical protein